MEAVAIKNSLGHTLEVKRGPKGEVLVRHSDLYPDGFGWVTSLARSASKANQWDPVEEKVRFSDGDYEEFVGKLNQIPILKTRDEELFLNEEDFELIQAAVGQLGSDSQ